MPSTPRILCVHQGYELYGSDRVFIQSLKALRQEWPEAFITVHLPQQGPISPHAEQYANRTVYGDLWALRRARLRPKFWRGLLDIPRCLKTSYHRAKEHDVVYLNTIILPGYIFWKRFFRKPFIVHAHELSEGVFMRVYQFWLRLSGVKLIANSNATAQSFSAIRAKTVVLNGSSDQAVEPPNPSSSLKILLIGRISERKGHAVALEAMSILRQKGFKDIQMRFVGGVFEDQDAFKRMINDRILSNNLQSSVTFHPFTHDPDEHYQWANIVLIPSTRPESFGLAALEAMTRQRTVIAANHGGVMEIVQNGSTGTLVEPGNPLQLAEALIRYIKRPDMLHQHGIQGRERFLERFQEDRYIQDFTAAIRSHVS